MIVKSYSFLDEEVKTQKCSFGENIYKVFLKTTCTNKTEVFNLEGEVSLKKENNSFRIIHKSFYVEEAIGSKRKFKNLSDTFFDYISNRKFEFADIIERNKL